MPTNLQRRLEGTSIAPNRQTNRRARAKLARDMQKYSLLHLCHQSAYSGGTHSSTHLRLVLDSAVRGRRAMHDKRHENRWRGIGLSAPCTPPPPGLPYTPLDFPGSLPLNGTGEGEERGRVGPSGCAPSDLDVTELADLHHSQRCWRLVDRRINSCCRHLHLLEGRNDLVGGHLAKASSRA